MAEEEKVVKEENPYLNVESASDNRKKKAFLEVNTAQNVRGGSGEFVWALFLIFLGIVFFLNTTGLVTWGIWGYIWQFWPVILVLIGVKLLAGSSRIAGFVVGIAALTTFAFILLTSLVVSNSRLLDYMHIHLPEWWQEINSSTVATQITKDVVINEDEYSGLKSRKIIVDVGVGNFSIADSDDNYFEVESSYYENFGEPQITERELRDQLTIEFSQESESRFGLPDGTPEYVMTVGQPNLKTDFSVNIGVGSGEIKFDEQELNSLRVDVGAGEFVLDISKKTVTDTTSISVDVGTGKTSITIPKEIGVELSYELGVGSISIDGETVTALGTEDNSYNTEGYDDSELKIKIDANVGVGSLEIIRE